MGSSKKPIRFRWIFLAVYVVIGGAVVGNCMLHLGHSPFCRYAYYLLLPAGLAASWLLSVLVPWGMIPPGLVRSTIEVILLPVPFLVSCLQYFFVGWLLDKLVEYWRRKTTA